MSVVPSAHYVVAATNSVGTSSLRNFLSNFHSIIFVAILVMTSLIRLMVIPRDPLSVPYFFFISSSSAFSFVLSSRNCVGSSPYDGSPVLYAISSTYIETSCSSHRCPPRVNAISCLMQLFSYWPLLKCGMSNRPIIPFLVSLAAHWNG
jgi:hypothetical protein